MATFYSGIWQVNVQADQLKQNRFGSPAVFRILTFDGKLYVASLDSDTVRLWKIGDNQGH